MRRASAKAMIASVAVLALCAPASVWAGGPSEQVPIGPRAIAMGSAFTAVASDATAMFWNPAGLVQIDYQEISGTHADLFGTGIKDNYVAFVLPITLNQVVGTDWYHSGYDDDELNFGENRFDFSYSRRLHRTVSLGATAKVLTRGIDLDGSTVREGRGFGMDFGVLVAPTRKVRLGLVAQDAFDTEVHYSEAGESLAYPRNVRFGSAYMPTSGSVVAFDVDDRYHLGGEYRLLDQLAVRGGWEKDRDGDEESTFTFGAGVKFGVFRFDYAYVDHPVLGGTSHFGLSMAFNWNPSQIRIEDVKARDLYLSLYKAYAHEPFGSVRIKNLQDEPLTAKISVRIPEIMALSSEQNNVVLRPKATQEFPLTAVLPEDVMARSGDKPVQVEVAATYQSARLPRTERSSGRCVAYGPGAVNWGQGIEQAAAFITTKDPHVDALAREACRVAAARGGYPLGNREIGFATAVFDALAVLGVTYVQDPYNPYSAMAGAQHAVDTVHYPRETLEKRSGDCDDTTVLIAALLGNVGIPTKIVDVPGHMFLLAGTGIHERNQVAMGVPQDMFVISGEEVWIPIETTALAGGFAEAWRVGAETYSSWASRGQLDLVDVAEAMGRFEAAAPVGEAGVTAELDLDKLGQMLESDVATVNAWSDEFLVSRYGEARDNVAVTAGALNELAHVYMLAGKTDDAKERLEEMLRRDPESARAHNNAAATYFAGGEVDKAIEHLEAAARLDPEDGGIWLNLGLVRYVSGDTLGAVEPLNRGIELAGGYLEACRLLGLPPDESLGADELGGLTADEARKLLEGVLKYIAMPDRSQPAERPVIRTKRGEPARELKTRVGAARAGERYSLREVLYWKD
jgi:hypothetical protein